MTISVIIPVYNAERFVASCLDRVLAEKTWDDDKVEVICVDDHSEDGSFSILKTYSDKGLIVADRLSENRGVSVARNRGIELCTGDVILFLDVDDFFENGVIVFIGQIFRVSQPDILVMRTRNDKDEKDNYPDFFRNDILYSADNLSDYDYLRGSVCGVAFCRKAIEGVSFPEGIRNGEDTIFFAKCLMNGVSVQFSQQTCYRVISREGSASRTYPIERYYSSKRAVNYVAELMKASQSNAGRKIYGKLYYQAVVNWLICACKVPELKCWDVISDLKNVPNIPKDSYNSLKKRRIVSVFNVSHWLLFVWFLLSKR